MQNHLTITVEEILQRKHFNNIAVIAGEKGLNRTVKWVHVLEVTEVGKLLNGHELILSTGVGWKESDDLFFLFLKQLIDSNVSGLCIEKGKYTSNIPQKVINLANEHNFPIILFLQEVPYVEITQDIHSLMINQHYELISNLENYSQELNKQLLTFNHYSDIIKFLQKYLKMQIIYITNENEIKCFPEIINLQEKHKIVELIKNNQSSAPFFMNKQPIQVLEKQYAELIVVSKENPLTEFESLILDRTATALAQHLLRELYVEEKRRLEETEWLSGWLQGEHSEQEIGEFLSYHNPDIKPDGCAVCILKLNTVSTSIVKADLTYLKILFRTIFEQQGFTLLVSEKRNYFIFIILNERCNNDWKDRVKVAIKKMRESEFFKKQKISGVSIAVGKYVNVLSELHKSFKAAKEALQILEKTNAEKLSCFYDDMHMYRLVSLVNKHADLNEFILEYLEPVISYDRRYNGKLMETLQTFLACNGSKQETAKRLYVVRQTLYHRVEKLKTLLGNNFMESEKRQALEFSILAYNYLNPTYESFRKAQKEM